MNEPKLETSKCCATCVHAIKCMRYIPVWKNEGGCEQYKYKENPKNDK